MVPDENDPVQEYQTDGGAEFGFDPDALYRVVRAAVTDAMLDVVGTLLLVGLGFVLVAIGGNALINAASVAGGAVGVGIVAVGLYVVAATLEVIPPVREWV